MTDWFAGTAHPVQPGVYVRLHGGHVRLYCYYDGGIWCRGSRDPDAAAARAGSPSRWQALPWCGLLTPPAQGYGPPVLEPQAAARAAVILTTGDLPC